MAVRLGWMPYYPQFNRNPLDLALQARIAGAKTEEDIVRWAVEQLKAGKIRFAVEDPDAPENWPRVWMIWRGNAIQSSAKGHEFFLRHYLGTHDNIIAEEQAGGKAKTVTFRESAPRGKMDLVVDLNFRMDSSAQYPDIVLPAAFWYEKNDLNTTDLHSFVHPLGAAGWRCTTTTVWLLPAPPSAPASSRAPACIITQWSIRSTSLSRRCAAAGMPVGTTA